MKKKVAGRIGATILAASIVMSMAIPVMAATTYVPVAGTSCTFNKNLIMDAGDTIPNVTFAFTIAPGLPVSADTSNNTVMQVLPGVGTPTVSSVTFTPSDTTETSAGTNIDVARTNIQRGGSDADAVQLDSGEKFATKVATVDFSGVTFDEPGIYRYIISETANAGHASAGITHDTDSDRVLDVYVVDGGDSVTEAWLYNENEYATEEAAQVAADEHQGVAQGSGDYSGITHRTAGPTLQVASYVLHTAESEPTINATMGSADVVASGNALSDKTDGMTNEMSGRKDLEIGNEVSGNQASRDKYFKYNVKFTDGSINADDAFVVSLSPSRSSTMNYGNADETPNETAATIYSNMSNPTDLTGAELTGEDGVDFYLQHDQKVVIRGLPADAKYTVTENAEDYVPSVLSGRTNTTGEGTIGTVAGENKLVQAGFMNTRNGIIPAGIMLAVAPFAIATMISGAGVAYISVRKKKEDEE